MSIRSLRGLFGSVLAVLIGLWPVAVMAAGPTIIVSVASYDEMVADAQHLARVFDAPQIASWPQMLDQLSNGQGLKGMDTTKRFGAFMTGLELKQLVADAEDEAENRKRPGSLVFFIPVADVQQFEATLAAAFPSPPQDKGMAKYNVLGTNFFAKPANSYYFFSENSAALDDLPDPKDFTKAQDDLAIEVDLQRLFAENRPLIEQQLTELDRSDEHVRNDPRLSEFGKQLQLEITDVFRAFVRSLVEDSDAAVVGVNVDAQRGTSTIGVGYRVKPHSRAAAQIEAVGGLENPLTGLVSPTTVGSLIASTRLNATFRKAVMAELQATQPVHDREIDNRPGLSQQQKQELKKLSQQYLQLVEKTLARDRLDFAVAVNARGPEDVQVLIATKVADGPAFARLIEKKVKIEMSDADRDQWSWNVATINGATIHCWDYPEFTTTVGGPLHWVVSNDTIIACVGRDSLAGLKAAANAKPVKSDSPIALQLDLVRLLALFDDKLDAEFKQTCQQFMQQGPGRISIEQTSRANELRWQFRVDDSVLQLAQRGVNRLMKSDFGQALERQVDEIQAAKAAENPTPDRKRPMSRVEALRQALTTVPSEPRGPDAHWYRSPIFSRHFAPGFSSRTESNREPFGPRRSASASRATQPSNTSRSGSSSSAKSKSTRTPAIRGGDTAKSSSKSQSRSIPPQRNRSAKSYPIRSEIPPDCERLASTAIVPKGTKLQVEWAGRWLPVTVLEDSREGPIPIHWDNYSTGFDEPVTRDSIIIDKSIQATLKTTE